MLDVFITGSESRLGKRLVTAGLAATMQSLGYSTGVYMPVQTGAVERNGYIEAPDLIYIKKADKNIKTYCSYLLRENEVPLIAASPWGTRCSRRSRRRWCGWRWTPSWAGNPFRRWSPRWRRGRCWRPRP